MREHAGDYPSEYAAITAVAWRLGTTPETLRKWIRQAAVDEGQAPRVSSEAAKEILELKRKVSELERTIEILPAAGGERTSSTCAECVPKLPAPTAAVQVRPPSRPVCKPALFAASTLRLQNELFCMCHWAASRIPEMRA